MKKLLIVCALASGIFIAIGAGYATSTTTEKARPVSIDTLMDTDYDLAFTTSDYDLDNVVCKGLRRGKCKGRPGCSWVRKSGRRKAYCRRKGGNVSKCAGLKRTECKLRARCRWVRKGGKRRAYCRIK